MKNITNNNAPSIPKNYECLLHIRKITATLVGSDSCFAQSALYLIYSLKN